MVIDLHCHVLPGIDDGPQTAQDAVAMVRVAAAGGTRTMVATPHVSWDYATDAAVIERAVAALNELLVAEGVPVTVAAGAEIAFDRIGEIAPPELAQLTLGDGPWLLVEPPFASSVAGLEHLVREIFSRGYGVVLAHPERCAAFQRDLEALQRLVAAGSLCSITASSLVGGFGRDAQRLATAMIERDLVHNVASDAHDAVRRAPGMRDALHHAQLDELADWLVLQMPQAILAGERLPPRPLAKAPRRSVLRRWWRPAY